MGVRSRVVGIVKTGLSNVNYGNINAIGPTHA